MRHGQGLDHGDALTRRAPRSAKPSRARTGVLLAAAALCLGSAGHGADVAESRAIAERISAMHKVTRSASGRFSVVGLNTGENLLVSRWADEVCERLDGCVGGLFPDGLARPLPILVESSEGSQGEPGATPAADGALCVRAPLQMDMEAANEALCAWLLAYAVSARLETAAAATNAAPVPQWLAVGLSRCIYPVTRAHDAELALELWDEGQVEPLADFLRTAEGELNPRSRAVAGALLTWVAAAPRRADALQGALRSLAAGRPIDLGWWRSVARHAAVWADVEAAWDNWMLRQGRVVHTPGRTTPATLRRFHAALLLYPGVCGIPLSSEPYRSMAWESLPAARDEVWTPGFCVSKRASLRLLAAGRSEDLKRATEAYVRFLDALAERKSVRTLTRRLAEAREASEKLWPQAIP